MVLFSMSKVSSSGNLQNLQILMVFFLEQWTAPQYISGTLVEGNVKSLEV